MNITLDQGLYGCNEMVDKYYQNEKCIPYIIRVDDKIAGFAVVMGINSEKFDIDFYIAEFFIIYDYRKQGVGQFVANSIFDKHKGKWDLFYTPKNLNGISRRYAFNKARAKMKPKKQWK